MFTKFTNDHNHRIEVDGQGTGETIDTSKGVTHTHKIVNWEVSEVDSHVHALSTDYVKGTKEYGNGDEPVTIVRDGETVEDKCKKITVSVEVSD